ARRLLLTAASAPQGEVGDLLGARIDRLIALGLQNDVPGLIRSAGQQALTPAGHRAGVDALLLDANNDAACQAARDALATSNDDAIALALIFCQRLAGEDSAAELGIAILQDTGGEVDDRFLELDRGIASGQPVALESLDQATPLLFAMALATGASIPEDALLDAPAPLLRAISRLEALPLETRLRAAERAVAAGAMSGGELGDLYRLATFNDDQIVNALSRADDAAGPVGRALLFQAALQQSLAAARAEAISALLRHAAAEDGQAGFLAVSRATGSEIAALVPGAELAWFSGEAAMALLAAGMPEAAARWWPLLEDRARNDSVAAAQAAVLWPIYRIAFGEQLPDDGTRMRQWWDASARLAPERVVGQAEMYVALLAAFDDRSAENLIVETLATPPAIETPDATVISDAGLLLALEAASREDRLGETVLLALVALGSGGPATADPMVLRAVVDALREVGLGREARLLAMEAAFAKGT
ncbi:MAG: hypothetical protein HN577_11270, partial [Rhodospirillaceae bacterium]|nr:hypothetical protein [Rhodospirillaceae bacterium]